MATSGGDPAAEPRELRSAGWLLVHRLTLAAVAVVVIVVARKRWFVTDEWDLWAARCVFGPARYGVLDPHEGHLVLLPILVGRALFAIVGLHHVLPYLVVLALAHVALGAALWSFCLDANVRPAVAACGVGAFLLNGAGGENLIFPYQATNVAALALVITAVRHFGRSGPWQRGDAVALAAILLASATYALGLVGALGLLMLGLRRRRWKPALIAGGLPILLWTLWFAAFHGRTPDPRTHLPFPTVLPHLPRHVVETFVLSASAVVHSTRLGVLATIGLGLGLAVFAVRARLAPPADAAVCLVFVAAAFAVAIAIASGPIVAVRDLFGHTQVAVPSRIVHDTVALCLPGVLIVLDRALRRVPVRVAPGLAAAGAITIVVWNWSTLTDTAHNWNSAGARVKAEVTAIERRPPAETARDDRSVDIALAPYLRVSDVIRLERSGALPDLTRRPEHGAGAQRR